MPLGLKAIVPKTPPIPTATSIAQQVPRALQKYGLAIAQRMQRYPAQQPAYSSDPKRKPRPYRRTGDLGRGWTAPGAIRVQGQTLTVVNRTTHRGISYPVYVQGPRTGGAGGRQTAVMRAKGWESLSDVAREVVRANRPIMNRAIVGRQA